MSRGLPAFPKKKRGRHFEIRITKPDGSRPWLKLGETRGEAYVNFIDYLKQLKSKQSDYPSYRATIKQGIDVYLEAKKKQLGSPFSLTRYSNSMDNFKEFLMVKYPSLLYLDEIQPNHISEFMHYRADEKHRQPRTVNVERDTLSNLFKYLIDERNLLLRNPVKKIKPFSEPDQDEFFYTLEQINKILETAKAFNKRVNWHVVFTTFFFTGMRRNELRFLTWDDLDLIKGKIYIRPKQVSQDFYFRVKNKEIRDIPIALELMPILKSLPHKSDRWVFVNSRGNTFSVDTIRTAFRKICKAAGVPVKKQHMTRHTWASQSSQQGVPLDVIQKIGGWKNPKTMDRYKHLSDSYMDKIFKDKFSLENRIEK